MFRILVGGMLRRVDGIGAVVGVVGEGGGGGVVAVGGVVAAAGGIFTF